MIKKNKKNKLYSVYISRRKSFEVNINCFQTFCHEYLTTKETYPVEINLLCNKEGVSLLYEASKCNISIYRFECKNKSLHLIKISSCFEKDQVYCVL